ncbi:MAG: hypothetical protein H6Q20_1269 [Bacteroidetes bacterium]|nr:hypothetical protein [Bacteroidota bacterium]
MANTTEAIFAIRRPRAQRRQHKSNVFIGIKQITIKMTLAAHSEE